MSSGRWHCAQFLKRIGATSLVKVIWLLADLLLFALAPGSASRHRAASARIAKIEIAPLMAFIVFTLYLVNVPVCQLFFQDKSKSGYSINPTRRDHQR